MDAKDPATGFVVRKRKLDLPVDSSGPDESRIEAVDAVGGHDDFDVAARVEPVQLGVINLNFILTFISKFKQKKSVRNFPGQELFLGYSLYQKLCSRTPYVRNTQWRNGWTVHF